MLRSRFGLLAARQKAQTFHRVYGETCACVPVTMFDTAEAWNVAVLSQQGLRQFNPFLMCPEMLSCEAPSFCFRWEFNLQTLCECRLSILDQVFRPRKDFHLQIKRLDWHSCFDIGKLFHGHSLSIFGRLSAPASRWENHKNELIDSITKIYGLEGMSDSWTWKV